MDTKHLITLINTIKSKASSKYTQWWDTLHYTRDAVKDDVFSEEYHTVKFSTTHFNSMYNVIAENNDVNLLRDYGSKSYLIAQLKHMLGGLYQMGYVCCKTDMPPHTDKFETGSHRVLLVLSNNSILIHRTDLPNVTVSRGDFFVIDTRKEHGATVVEGDPEQEYLIIENFWYDFTELPEQLTAIAV